MQYLSHIIAIALLCSACSAISGEKFRIDLHSASLVTETILKDIYSEWRIDKYPLFLKSCFMHKSSWEILKLKFMFAILSAELATTPHDFVISFLGSSVAAGHDSLFNQSYPIVLGDLMREAFKPVRINLITRNVALGNNPCVPYDICVKIFAGLDADIVQWEQTFNCPSNPSIKEQFVRQALLIPSKPIVVFADSHTATWKTTDCTDIKPKTNLTTLERALLDAPINNLVTNLNKDEFKRAHGNIQEITRIYGSAGIQTFTHTKYSEYKCQGPYVPGWQEGAAPWHPSFRSHRLRASQMAYVWLSAWRDALDELYVEYQARTVDDLLKETVRKIHGYYYHSFQHSQDVAKKHNLFHALTKAQDGDTTQKNLASNETGLTTEGLQSSMVHERISLPGHIYPSIALDNVQCFTDYEPRPVRESSLLGLVVSGRANSDSGPGWKYTIYENLVSPALVKKSISRGYLDFKHLLYGNSSDGPLSLRIHANQPGPVLVCETPGIWGSLPKGFDHLWVTGTQVFVTPVKSPADSTFQFNQSASTLLPFTYTKRLEICMESTANVSTGHHVLTIVPMNTTKIIVSWLLVP